jgi:hypothetical protein
MHSHRSMHAPALPVGVGICTGRKNETQADRATTLGTCLDTQIHLKFCYVKRRFSSHQNVGTYMEY